MDKRCRINLWVLIATAHSYLHVCTNTPTEQYTYGLRAKTVSMTNTVSSKENEMHTKTVYREDVFSCDECIT
jgi:ssDNA-binding Zn-finger/Zn-ribbon topoisomerase 1